MTPTPTTPSPYANQQPPPTHGYGGLLLAVLVLSHRLRRAVGFLAAIAVAGGVILAGVATAVGQPQAANTGVAAMLAGLGLWAVAAGPAWLLGIVVEDVRDDWFSDDADDESAGSRRTQAH